MAAMSAVCRPGPYHHWYDYERNWSKWDKWSA